MVIVNENGKACDSQYSKEGQGVRQGCTIYVTMAIKQLYGQHGERSKARVQWWGGDGSDDAVAPV